MYTSFCQDCKSALSDLWTSVQAIHAAQTRNADSKVFQPAYAEAENLKLEQQKKDACKAARERINAIMDKADEDAASLDMIELFNVEPDERNHKRLMELLSGRYTLSVEQLQHLLDTYVPATDRVSLNAVRTYCECRSMRVVAADTASRRSGISEIRASALSVVSRIENTSYRNGNRDLSAGLSVSDFCKDGDFAAELYGRLGQTFSGTLVPARVEPENPLNLHFRGVRDSDKKAG